MCMTLQKGTGSFITAILLTSSFMHFPHQVYSVQIFSWSKMKQGVRIKLKNSFPTVFAFFAPTIFKHDRNLKRRWKLFINKRTFSFEILPKYFLIHHRGILPCTQFSEKVNNVIMYYCICFYLETHLEGQCSEGKIILI